MALPKKVKRKAVAKPPHELTITVMQQVFVLEYIKDFNYKKAAIRAGYSPRAAAQTAHKLSRMPHIKKAIDEAIAERMSTLRIEGATVLNMWYNIATVNRSEIVNVVKIPCGKCFDGEENLAEAIDPICVACRGRGVDEVVVSDTSSLSPEAQWVFEGAKRTKYGVEVQLADRGKALENLARHMGMFNDKLDITTNGKDVPAGLGHFYGRDVEECDDED